MMYKSLSITDFFKSYTQPRQNKRASDAGLNDARVSKRSRSNTPDGAARAGPHDQTKAGTPEHVGPTGFRGKSSATASIARSSSHGSDGTQPLGSGEVPETGEGEPSGSQGPVLMSSQRVVVNGEVIIRNSDDESDSEVSLDDIDELLVARKSTVALSSPNVSDPRRPLSSGSARENGSVTRSKTKGATTLSTHQPSAIPARPTYKFSLDSLKRQNKATEAAEAGTAQAWSLLDSFKDKASSPITHSIPTSKAEKINANLVASVFKDKGNEEDIARLMTAIQRTEAFYQGKAWAFFEDVESSTNAPFPNELDPRWHTTFSDASFRDQAFLGGFVGDLASKDILPEALLPWLLHTVCLEPRGDLRHSYGHTLEEAQTLITPLLTSSRIGTLFRQIGASTAALDVSTPINPRVKTAQDFEVADWSRLVALLDLLGRTSNHLTMESRIYTLCLLCRLLLDISIVQSFEALIAVEDGFMNVLRAIPDISYEHEIQLVLATIYSFVTDPLLRLQLLQNIPTCSPRSIVFRRRLALAYFFHDKHYLKKSAADLIDLRSIATQLQNPCFTIRNDTDYPELVSLIGILSIGIDSGDPPPPNSDVQEKVSFNENIDLIASRIGEMFTSIVDTGASHMKRTEAKEMLEAFHSKLLYAVRTKPKPKTMMFGDSDALSSMQKKAFRSFFERKMDDI